MNIYRNWCSVFTFHLKKSLEFDEGIYLSLEKWFKKVRVNFLNGHPN